MMAKAQPPISLPQRADADYEHEESAGVTAQSSVANLPSPDAIETGWDVEQAMLLESEELEVPAQDKSQASAAFWMAVNTIATIGIVWSSIHSLHGALIYWVHRSSQTKPFFLI